MISRQTITYISFGVAILLLVLCFVLCFWWSHRKRKIRSFILVTRAFYLDWYLIWITNRDYSVKNNCIDKDTFLRSLHLQSVEMTVGHSALVNAGVWSVSLSLVRTEAFFIKYTEYLQTLLKSSPLDQKTLLQNSTLPAVIVSKRFTKLAGFAVPAMKRNNFIIQKKPGPKH